MCPIIIQFKINLKACCVCIVYPVPDRGTGTCARDRRALQQLALCPLPSFSGHATVMLYIIDISVLCLYQDAESGEP